MKYKCKLKIKNSLANKGELAIYSYCFSWRYGFQSFLLDVGDETKMLDFYKNTDITKIINQIKTEILKSRKARRTTEVKNTIKEIENKFNTITIEV